MTATTPHPIMTRLKARGITEVVIIDDAFDEPDVDSLGTSAIEQFWADVKAKQDAIAELKALGLACEEPFEITHKQVAALFGALTKLKAAEAACRQLFSTLLGKRAEIERFTTPIQETLGVAVVSLGVGDEFNHATARLVFLDYYLGTEKTENAVKAAVRKAREIYKAYPADGEKPLIVLMSSIAEVADHKEEFRKQSGLLGGMFDFVPKRDLGIADKLFLKLGSWAMGLPEGYKIQHFVEAIERSAKKAAEAFIDGVKGLTLEDYGHIQRLTLQEDGHPLGDYMLWLFGSYFGRMLFHGQPEVRKHQRAIDSLWVETPPPCQQPPSVILAEMYKSALFDDAVEDLAPHPLSLPGTPEDVEAPHIRLGDLFLRDGSHEALLVISPECDLAFSPRGKRVCDPEQSVLLIPGQLQSLDEPLPAGADLRTELFEYGGKAYRILWNRKQVRSERMGRIAHCLRSFKYERRARLRLPCALQVQQAFAADITRVGMPVAPPIYRPVKLRAYAEAEDGKHWPLHEARDDAAFLALGRSGTHLVLTVDYVVWLQEQLEAVAAVFDAKKAKLGDQKGGNEGAKLAQRAREVRSFKGNYDALLGLLEPKLLKSLTKRMDLEKKLLCLAPDGDFSGAYDTKTPPITLVIDGQTAEKEEE